MRGDAQRLRDATFECECVARCERADRRDAGPERKRLVLQDETAGGRPDEPADLPRRARESHVAAEHPRLREIDDERGVDRAVQALAERKHADGGAEDDRGLGPCQPFAGGGDGDERPHPDDAHQREAT